ncbi:hypothetical protein CR513_53400, partial [Mucuna pruriens]
MTLLGCVDAIKAKEILEEIHEGVFGTHANGHAMTKKILRAGIGTKCFPLPYTDTAHRSAPLQEQQVKRAFDKKVHSRESQEGDLVLKKILLAQKDHRGKWTPNYDGPYMVKKTFLGGAMILINMDNKYLLHPVNSDVVKKFYP